MERRSEFRDDFVDMTAAVTDHEVDLYDPGGEACGDARNVQIDHHAAGAVGIDLVGALFPPWRREVGTGEVVALIIPLRELALAVENLDAVHNHRRRTEEEQACRK